MDNFIRLASMKNPHVIPVTSENIKYKLGDEVVITEGEFKGIGERVYTARVFAEKAPKSVTVAGAPVEFEYDGQYITFELGDAKEASIVLG